MTDSSNINSVYVYVGTNFMFKTRDVMQKVVKCEVELMSKSYLCKICQETFLNNEKTKLFY